MHTAVLHTPRRPLPPPPTLTSQYITPTPQTNNNLTMTGLRRRHLGRFNRDRLPRRRLARGRVRDVAVCVHACVHAVS